MKKDFLIHYNGGGKYFKPFLVMKLCGLFILLFTFQLSANVFSQTHLNINVNNANIREVIQQIKEQSDYTFVYNVEEIDQLEHVSINVKNSNVAEVLNLCLKGSPYTFSILDNVIVIKKVANLPQAQPIRLIKGIVVDENNSPLPGVTILIKGTKVGVSSGIDGKFELAQAKDSTVTLLFTFVGMKSVEVRYSGQKDLKVVMKEDTQTMDEVVITGYQVVDKRKSTSAVTSVKMDDLMIPGATSLDQMLEGRIPDMVFMSNSGEVGIVPRIRIRGTSTLIGNREPLWVLDGIPLTDPVPVSPSELNDPDYINRIGNAIAGINPQDIERIDVLKDAAATALYGVKAANGVIVVTTKTGRVGKTMVNYNFSGTFRQRPRYSDRQIDVMNSRERVQFSKELATSHYAYTSLKTSFGYEKLYQQKYNNLISEEQFNEGVKKLESENTDWFKLLTEDVFSHQHSLSISGGSDNLRYYSSIGYVRDNDVIRGNNNERYSVAMKLDAKISDRFSTTIGLNGNVATRDYNQESINPMNYAYTMSRCLPAYNEDGTFYFYERTARKGKNFQYNILNELANSGYKQDGSGLILTANVRWEATSFLNINALTSYSISTTEIEKYWGEKTWYASNLRLSETGVEPSDPDSELPYGGELSKDYTHNRSYTLRLQANMNKSLGVNNDHNIDATLGLEASSSKYDGYGNVSRGYYPERGKQFIENVDLKQFTGYNTWLTNNNPKVTDNLENRMSGYLSAAYSFRGIATIRGDIRFDGSNSFGDRSNNKLLPVWAVSGLYNLSEQLAKEVKWISALRIKASYGYQGRMLNTESPVMIIKKGSPNAYYNEYTSQVVSFANPYLKWEKTGTFNLGLEFSLLDDRIQGELSYYNKKTKDAFLNKPVNTINGVSTYTINSGDILNRGYSVSLTGVPYRTADMSWIVSVSLSKIYNRMNTLPGAEQYELQDFLNGTALVKGKPVGTFYSYKYVGLSPVDGGPLFDDMEDRMTELQGLSKYETFTTVLKNSGNREPEMTGSINSNFRYKNFRFGISMAYSLGAKIRLFRMYGGATSIEKANTIVPEYNVNRAMLKRWQKPGDEQYTDIPAVLSPNTDAYANYSKHFSNMISDIPTFAQNAWDMYDYSDHRVVSGDYLKCNNMSFSYELKPQWLEKAYISRMEVGVSTTNLFTICSSKLKGQTPTQSGFASIQLSERPTYTLRMSVSF